jgi:hypothetical protein
VNLGRLIETLTFRSREREPEFAGENNQHYGDYTDEITAARSEHGLTGGGGAPPGYVHEYDEGRPQK